MNKTVLFLQSEIHGYHLPLISRLINKYHYDVKIIYWDKDTLTPFTPPIISGAEFIKRSKFKSFKEIIEYCDQLNLSLVRIAGWMDWSYVKVSRYLKKKGIVTVVCSDTQWSGSLRQRIGRFTLAKYIRTSFSFMMVAGPYQFEYARKLGFAKKDILFNNLSANSDKFSTMNCRGTEDFQKTLLYVGRLVEEKGIAFLVEVWNSIEDKKGWKLEIVGSGPLEGSFRSSPSIVLRDFVSNDKIAELMRNCGFFVLPSYKEPWGVVVHEAALSGVPIICSDQVGSIPVFLINGFNGFIFKSESKMDLKNKLNQVLSLNEGDIASLRANSNLLGHRITTDISVASLVSAIK